MLLTSSAHAHAGGIFQCTAGTGMQSTCPPTTYCVRGIMQHQPAGIANRHTLAVTTTRPPSNRNRKTRPIKNGSFGQTGTELARSTGTDFVPALRVFMGKSVVPNWHTHDVDAPFACSTMPGSLGLFFREPTCPLERADTSFCDRGVPVTSRYSLWDSDFWDTERSAQFLYARAPFRVQKK
jgi:hypothetical protein